LAEEKITIIGVGDDGPAGLPDSVQKRIESADLLIGDQRTLAAFPSAKGERMPGADLEASLTAIQSQPDRQVAILAQGDPLFYGLARFLCDKLGKERFVVIPHVSTMQLAFARVKESWEEAYLTNLANHSLPTVVEKIRTPERVGLFTTDKNPPAVVSKALLDRGIDYFSAYVCENLGSPDERVTQGSLADIAGGEFASLNVMILIRKPDAPDRPREATGQRLFGNPDEAFMQAKPKHGLLTPAEVRALALSELDLSPTSIVWDVGAGCGSVSIEAAQIASAGTAYAIEMDIEDHHLIVENMKRFNVHNVMAVLGKAPEAWAELPDPHAVFLEGSGREISRLIAQAYDRLRGGGRLVASVGSIENLSDVHRTMRERAPDVHVWMVNVARGVQQLDRMRFDALNPRFLLALVKPSES